MPAKNTTFFFGFSFWLRSGTSGFAFFLCHLVCHFWRLIGVEVVKVVVIDLCVVVVLDFHAVPHPAGNDMGRDP
jgi:hypothetical protein